MLAKTHSIGLPVPIHPAIRPAQGGAASAWRRLPVRPFSQVAHANPIVRYFASIGSLSEGEVGELKQLLNFVRQYPAHTELCAEGECQQPRILVTGWACQLHVLRSGRRQIVRFLLPGDLIGSLEWPAQPPISSVVALTPGTLADARPLVQAVYEPDNINTGFATLVRLAKRAEEVGLRDHIVRLGGRTAYERLVHLVLELHSRLYAVGLADIDSFILPLTQEAIADALGMSFVHTNRTLQQIRRDGLFVIRSGTVTIQNMERMRAVAEWVEA